MGSELLEHGVEIDAPELACLEAVWAFDTYPDWQSAVRDVEVLERDGDTAVVEFRIDAKLKHVRYVLRYHREAPHRIWWEYVEGDVRSIAGDYTFAPLEGGRTLATYRLDIDPGRFVPGPIRRFLTDQAMRGSVSELKARVEGG